MQTIAVNKIDANTTELSLQAGGYGVAAVFTQGMSLADMIGQLQRLERLFVAHETKLRKAENLYVLCSYRRLAEEYTNAMNAAFGLRMRLVHVDDRDALRGLRDITVRVIDYPDWWSQAGDYYPVFCKAHRIILEQVESRGFHRNDNPLPGPLGL